MKLRYLLAGLLLGMISRSWAQNTADDVNLFQTYLQDANFVSVREPRENADLCIF